MAQKEEQILPIFLQTDNATEFLKPNESGFIKGMGFDQQGNPSEEAGNQNGTEAGYNNLVQTPIRSNRVLDTLPKNSLPAGINKNYGSFESVETNEFYYANINSNGNHGIYVVNCDTGEWNTVIIDQNLPFTERQEGFIADHRWSIRFVKDAEKNVVAKFLLYTNGEGWQGWINVTAAIATNGFDASLYSYWNLTPPHFDRRELLEWAIRPPMYNPQAKAIPNTADDTGKVNRMIDTAFQIAIRFRNTDGRISVLSPYSLPLIIKSEDFLNNPDNLPKNALFTLCAGSPLTESIDILIRKDSANKNSIPSIIEWSDWYLYDTIYKYSDSSTSESSVLGTPYWLRTNPWGNYSYDPNLNQVQYKFDNSKALQIIDQNDAVRLYNDIPQKSIALTDLGDGELLSDNLRDYDNLSAAMLQKISAQVKEKTTTDCPVPLRNITLYAYIGRCGDRFIYYSQIGYYVGQDTTVRFGSLGTDGTSTLATFLESESKSFGLDFADKKSLRVYLKGTPYYADGEWIQVNSDNSKVILSGPLDFGNNDNLEYVQNVFKSQGYFACQFNLKVPAGKYIATLGRHNVSSSGDYRNTSTYIEGIANSRQKSSSSVGIPTPFNSGFVSIKPDAIQTYSKEMEIDCTNGDVDVWGNGQDLFYVYCPYITHQGNGAYRFIEGYLQESASSPLGVELFPYQLTQITDDWGRYTDKNGFYFAYTKANSAAGANIQVICKLNCQYPVSFIIPTNQGGSGWRPNGVAYLSDHNNGITGDCNRIIYSGKITSLDGTVGYSNIAVSIKDGATVYTQSDGTFVLIIHNGQNTLRVSNVYVNSGGDFLITIANCGNIPLFSFNEALAACVVCIKRNYPIPLNLAVNAQGGTQYSLKENGVYSIGIAVADLAGRLGFINVVSDIYVYSFLKRNDTLATFFQLLILGKLGLSSDYSWIAPYVTDQIGISGYIQWVADSIVYVDANGNVVSDQASAVFMSVNITSLYNANIGRNFTLLTNYQFVNGDRLRVLDNGDGQLLDIADFGEPIDVQILGTNYNQAAISAGIIPNSSPTPIINNNISNNVTTNVTAASGSSTVTTLQTTQNETNITLYVKYDARFNALLKNTGLWIEIYTPSQTVENVPYNELEWHPVINGELANFDGFSNGQPVYSYPTVIDINFWDTYLFSRSINIPGVGNQFFNHPFESPNISDTFGYKISSGGRNNFKNNYAKQMWYTDEVIKSDNFVSQGLLNGIGTFRSENRKAFKDFKSGPIVMSKAVRNVVFFLCENDFFVTDYNFQYIFANQQGVQVANLENSLGSPHQKIGSNYGMRQEDTGSVVSYEEFISWYDRRNQAWVLSDYKTARDIGLFNPNEGVTGGMSSYINSKTKAISVWNEASPVSSKFDVIGGIDMERGNLYLTFRPRRSNSNDPSSYGTHRRGIDLLHQETLVYNTITRRFVRFENFTPESYGKMRGKTTGMQLITFAAGVPYLHNSGNASYNNFYGVQYDPVIVGIFNQNQAINKIFANLCLDINGPGMYIDFLRTNEPNSFSYVPMNLIKRKENKYYLSLMRDMNSYFPPTKENEFRSTLIDGKRIFNLYLLFRLIGDPDNRGKYFELKTVYNLITDSTNEKK